MRKVIIYFLIATLIFLSGCSEDEKTTSEDIYFFQNQIKAIANQHDYSVSFDFDEFGEYCATINLMENGAPLENVELKLTVGNLKTITLSFDAEYRVIDKYLLIAIDFINSVSEFKITAELIRETLQSEEYIFRKSDDYLLITRSFGFWVDWEIDYTEYSNQPILELYTHIKEREEL